MYPTTEVLHRIFNIRVSAVIGNREEVLSSGTMFAIELNSRQYLITARHIAEHIARDTLVKVWRNGDWYSIPTSVVGHGEGIVDVSVLAPAVGLVPVEYHHLPSLGMGGVILGQEMMFLGFPSGYDVSKTHLLSTGFPIPLVKYARLSGMGIQGYPMWLDGHNNEGFSGSPICFVKQDTNEMRIAGVIAAYQQVPKPVLTPHGHDTGLRHWENMGLGLAWDIQYCVDIINQNPIGLELPNR
ncbi:MAG: hypothetical protein OXC95_00185 [Dehalococcoidia bacterium]|nr:hypothetical protein [Dehalococcoidia bacterium]